MSANQKSSRATKRASTKYESTSNVCGYNAGAADPLCDGDDLLHVGCNDEVPNHVIMRLAVNVQPPLADAIVGGAAAGPACANGERKVASELFDPTSASSTPQCDCGSNQPDPYNKHHPLFSTIGTSAGDALPVDAVEAIASTGSSKPTLSRNVVRLLADFEEKSKNDEWPLSTSVHCYWCCHSFASTPLGLPMRYKNGKFYVIGCFCSLECACAYNFNHNFGLNDSIDERLMRYSLLNALSAKVGGPVAVTSAPTRLSLKMFGGIMNIDEFRSYSQPRDGGTGAVTAASDGAGATVHDSVKRHLIIHTPPMHSTTQYMEEIHHRDMSSDYKYIPIDADRVSRYQEQIRLTRKKPLMNYKNTLDHTMNLKYHHRQKKPDA